MINLLKMTGGRWQDAIRLLLFLVFIPLTSAIFAALVAIGGPVVHPPLAKVAAPLVCSGEMIAEQESIKRPGGQTYSEMEFYCATEGGRTKVSTALRYWMFGIYFLIAWLFLSLLALAGQWTWRSLPAKRVKN